MRTVAILLALLSIACGTESRAAKASLSPLPNVVLVCWDTVRADRLTPYGYDVHPSTPFLDELASKGLVFEDTWSTAGWTKPSVSSFLTGTHPARHGVYDGSSKEASGIVSDVLPDDATTIAEVLSDAGYRTAAFVKNGHLRPGLGLEQGFDHYVDRVGDSRDIRWAALDWLDDAESEGPVFLYLHTIDAHWPWDVPDEYAGRFAPLERVQRFRARSSPELFDRIEAGDEAWTPADQAEIDGLYAGALRFQDEQLRLFFKGLEQRGLAENLVFALVSDHGESLGENGRFGHGHGLSPELLQVPFLISGTGIPSGRADRPASLVDLFPTLLSAAGIDAPDTHDGLDLLTTSPGPADRFAEHRAPDRFIAALRRQDRSVELDWLAPAPSADTIPFRSGDRVEVKFVRIADRWVALEVEEGDDERDDPAELKGPLGELDGGRVVVENRAYELASDYRTVWEEGAEAVDPQPGTLVKLRIEEPGPRVTRIKVYAQDVEVERELRGAVERVEGSAEDGRLVIAGRTVAIDGQTILDGSAERRLERSALLDLLATADRSGTDEIFTVERSAFLLSGTTRSASAFESVDLEQTLRAHLSDSAARRLWTADDPRVVLEDDDVEALRRLGYLR